MMTEMTLHQKTKPPGSLLSIQLRGLALMLVACLTLWTSIIPRASAQDLTAPTQVVNEYLGSLVKGDTQKLVQLIDGRMKQNNRQLLLNPQTYSKFLKTNYAGVQTTLEEVTLVGAKVRARVRFDYPSQESSTIEFLLAESKGSWKIIDEVY
jgi:predicted ester cyclase